MSIKIDYNGSYPNLCSGDLIVTIEGMEWVFPSFCLSSGGSVSFDSEWNEEVTEVEWTITDWPENFPEGMKAQVVDAFNNSEEQGCCGGCV